jgi:hypothetical protein
VRVVSHIEGVSGVETQPVEDFEERLGARLLDA